MYEAGRQSGAVPLLARIPLLARLDPRALRELAAASCLTDFPTGASLVVEGAAAPGWYCAVETGAVQLSRSGPAGATPVERVGPGQGFSAGEAGRPAPWTARAIEPTRCWLVPQAALRAALARPNGAGIDARPRGELSLFQHRVRDLVRRPPVTIRAGTPIAQAARAMSEHGVGSVVVVDDSGAPVGIVTDRDLRTKVVARGLPATAAVAAVASSPLVAVEVSGFAFDALLEMTRRSIHHLGVTDGGRLVGVISSNDFVAFQAAYPVSLAREIEGQPSIEALAAVGPRLTAMVRRLAAEGASAFDLGQIVAELNDRLVRRAIALAEAALEAEGQGRPPVPYSWLVAGSEGRREQTLKTDQDNGLVYEDPPPDLAEGSARYFARLAETVGAALVRLGFPRCDGGFTAENPRWRQPRSVWEHLFRAWMETPHPERLLFASIYFDLRPVGGDEAPGRALWAWVCNEAPSRTLFQRYMAKIAVERRAPLGLFRQFVVERSGPRRGTLDVKARGVFPMTQAMRVYALHLGLRETNTVERLVGAGAAGLLPAAEVEELRAAYDVILRVRLAHQLACLDAGQPPDNFVDPRALGKLDRLLLKEAFKALGRLQGDLAERFQTALLA